MNIVNSNSNGCSLIVFAARRQAATFEREGEWRRAEGVAARRRTSHGCAEEMPEGTMRGFIIQAIEINHLY
jgi:hypothetical protein